MFKALGDPVRLRLLSLIASATRAEGGEVCVCDLTGAFDVQQPTISHHLRVLREAGLVDCERRGTWVYYWVLPGALEPAVVSAAVPGERDTVTAASCRRRLPAHRPRMPRRGAAGARAAAEAVGTGALVMVVVGSGIQATRLDR